MLRSRSSRADGDSNPGPPACDRSGGRYSIRTDPAPDSGRPIHGKSVSRRHIGNRNDASADLYAQTDAYAQINLRSRAHPNHTACADNRFHAHPSHPSHHAGHNSSTPTSPCHRSTHADACTAAPVADSRMRAELYLGLRTGLGAR